MALFGVNKEEHEQTVAELQEALQALAQTRRDLAVSEKKLGVSEKKLEEVNHQLESAKESESRLQAIVDKIAYPQRWQRFGHCWFLVDTISCIEEDYLSGDAARINGYDLKKKDTSVRQVIAVIEAHRQAQEKQDSNASDIDSSGAPAPAKAPLPGALPAAPKPRVFRLG
jgi:septal ring factor EnvC (AmiA/AmiB activator)